MGRSRSVVLRHDVAATLAAGLPCLVLWHVLHAGCLEAVEFCESETRACGGKHMPSAA